VLRGDLSADIGGQVTSFSRHQGLNAPADISFSLVAYLRFFLVKGASHCMSVSPVEGSKTTCLINMQAIFE
jgi:hypothetical protein